MAGMIIRILMALIIVIFILGLTAGFIGGVYMESKHLSKSCEGWARNYCICPEDIPQFKYEPSINLTFLLNNSSE